MLINARTGRVAPAYILCLFLAWPLATTLAEDTPQETTPPNREKIDRIVVSPNRSVNKVGEVGSSVSVLNSTEIDQSGVRNVVEILRRLPGVEVVQAGGNGRTATVFVRGAESDQTLVLIDGVRVNTAADGSFDFADLRVDNIDRIEVLRGPQSVLYGSEALGGVISIITNRSSEGNALTLRAEGGSYSSHEYGIRASVLQNNVASSTSLSFATSNGISAALAGKGNSEADSYENITLSTSNDVTLDNDWQGSVTGRYQRGDTQLDGFDFATGPVDDLNYTQQHELTTAGLKLGKNTGIIRPRIELGVMQDTLSGNDPDTEFNAYDIRNQGFFPTAQIDIVPNDWSVTALGYSYENRAARSRENFDTSRNVHGIFLNQQVKLFNLLSWSGGARYERYSDFGNQATYRTTLSSPVEKLSSRLHTSIGTAFKAPTFNELYFPAFGNPNLEPEKSTGFDVGVETTALSGSVVNDLTFFRSDFEDLISFNTADFTGQNLESSKAQGLEESLQVQVSDVLSFGVAYTFQESQNEESGQALPRRPKHKVTTNVLIKPIEKLSIDALFLMVKDRIDSDLSNMDDYERVDLTVRYEAKNVTPYLRVVNLFDARYEEVTGYGTPGLSAFAGFEVKL
jgi:vitamin B12 transporter